MALKSWCNYRELKISVLKLPTSVFFQAIMTKSALLRKKILTVVPLVCYSEMLNLTSKSQTVDMYLTKNRGIQCI